MAYSRHVGLFGYDLYLYMTLTGKTTCLTLHLTTVRYLTAKPFVLLADFSSDFLVIHISCYTFFFVEIIYLNEYSATEHLSVYSRKHFISLKRISYDVYVDEVC